MPQYRVRGHRGHLIGDRKKGGSPEKLDKTGGYLTRDRSKEPYGAKVRDRSTVLYTGQERGGLKSQGMVQDRAGHCYFLKRKSFIVKH